MPWIVSASTSAQPSEATSGAMLMGWVNVFAAETDREARRQFTSVQQAFINLRRGIPGPVPAPIDDIKAYAADFEIAQIAQALAYSAVGSAENVERQLQSILTETNPDELLVTGHFYDHAARLRSFELVAAMRTRLGGG